MTQKQENNKLRFALAALVLWGFWAFLPKLAMQTMLPPSVLFYEALGSLFVAVPVLVYLKGRVVWDKRGVAITASASLINLGALLSFYIALGLGPVATIVTATALYPVIVLLLARVILKEKINTVQMLAVGMALVSIALLAG